MKTLIATLLATAAGASFAAAPTAALNHDPATYRNVTQKALTEYRAAAAKCESMNGNDKEVCMAEAKLARTRTEYDALSQYNNTASGRATARTNVANAEFALAKAKCDGKSGADKDSCMSNAKSVHTAALADAKANRADSTTTSSGSSGSSGSTGSGAGAQAAVDKCAQAGGDAKTGCLVETKASPVRENAAEVASRTSNAADNAASKTRDAAATAAEKTKAVAATAAEKTREVAHTAVEKTKQAASTVAQKTETAMDHAGDNTRQAASTAANKTDNALDRAGDDTRQAAATTADKTADATAKTRVAASDTAITTKVKAGLVKVPNLDSLSVHVETEKGVVMLSGFVDSKAQADQAVQVAKGVDGVTSVKSAIKVK
jgi:osmotically-inducible protein OsmY